MSNEDPTAVSGTLLENPNADPAGQPKSDIAPVKQAQPQSPGWVKEHLSEVEGSEKLGKFNGVAALAKAYLNLESYQGSSVRVPGDNATAEELNKFYEKTGRPPSPEGYELHISDDPGQGAEAAAAFRAQVHKLGLSKKQARDFWDWSAEYGRGHVKALQTEAQTKEQQGLNTLQGEWGVEYGPNVGKATRVIQRFGGPDALQFMQKSRVGANPIMMRMFVAIGNAISEDVLIGGTPVPAIPAGETELFAYENSPDLK